MNKYNNLKSILNNKINIFLDEYDNIHNMNKDKLKDIILYSLNGGKRLRPIIALEICNSLSNEYERAYKFAIAIELIHNSSLIIDDLPCMDNDDYRRDNLSFHKKYSQTLAQIIASFMISLSLDLIHQSFEIKKLKIILKYLSKNLGINGASMGQYLDTDKINNKCNKKIEIKYLLKMKTTSIFEIAFVGGYLLGNGDIDNIDNIINCCDHFGYIFQIYDDFYDIEQDKKRKELNLIDPNIINNFGKDYSYKEFNIYIEKFKNDFNNYNLLSEIIIEICNYLEYKVNNKYNELS